MALLLCTWIILYGDVSVGVGVGVITDYLIAAITNEMICCVSMLSFYI
jgi:hypothetical protein